MALNDFRLVLHQGPEDSREFPLTKPETILGRDAAADIVLEAAAVSRRHARILRQGEQFFLEDLASSNGTFLNERRLDQRSLLAPGDRIRLGRTVSLTFQAPQGSKAISPSASTPAPQETALEGDPHAVETLFAQEALFSAPEEPPYLDIAIAGSPPQSYPLQAETLSLGRAEDNDLVIASKIVSRHHARLERTPAGYQIVPLPEASNPVLFEGRPLTQPRPLQHGDLLRIGSQDPGLMVSLAYRYPLAAGTDETRQIAFGEKTSLQIGRDRGNDVVLDAPTVSRYHAQLERSGQRYRLRDLHSANGTFVNDRRVEGEAWVSPDDSIRIGPYRFVLGQDRLEQYDETRGLRLEARGLNKWVRKDLNILQDISLVFNPREFIVVVGQSGGGKSTLVDALAGYRPATQGQVRVNEIDVYRHFDAIRQNIGYVPQKDIIHMELTVYQALDYAAQLRMPADTSKAERQQRVMEVLQDLDLVHRKDVQISGLSGGQQKRVSIGVELLTRPGLFFLDEPSSGLDPGTETALMQLMRRLADQGRTIVLITHATKNVMLADKVVFLARGGYLAWFGPPEEALQYFDRYRSEGERRAGPMEFDEIYAVLDDSSKGSAAEWAERYRAHPAYERYVRQPLGLEQAAEPAKPAAPAAPAKTAGSAKAAKQAPIGSGLGPAKPPRSSTSALRQFLILSGRNIKILTRDRFSLILMLAAAPVVGLLDFVLASVLGRDPLSFANGSLFDVNTISFLLPVNAVMVGALAQMREIVKEADIYKRERLVNLKILPYVLSKVWVAGMLALYQAGAYLLIRYLAFDMPGGILEIGLFYISLVLAIMAGMMLGLFASALSPNANAVPLIVILLIIPQVVLGGALIPLPSALSTPTSTRWAYQALVATSGAGSAVAADACWSLPEALRQNLSLDDKQELGCSCMGLNALQQSSCDFPGLGQFYDPALEQAPPAAPAEVGDPPPEPELPPPPVEPADQADTVAVADYLTNLSQYQGNVEKIQNDYKTELENYQSRARVYQAEAIAYQQERAKYEIARNAAVGKAEGLIGQFQKDFAWTFADKSDRGAFLAAVASTWLAQAIIIGLFFAGTLVLMWRKDRL